VSGGVQTRPVEVTTWYLEMLERAQLCTAPVPDPAPEIVRVAVPTPVLNRTLYAQVGAPWHWTDRLPWTDERWLQYLDRPEVQTWVLRVNARLAGYVELEKQPGDDVEIAYFGLLPGFIGRGLGGHLLGVGIDKAWDMGAKRVWVHTCSLDHPAALDTYRKRGMVVYKQESMIREIAG
jgi:ribosomal protein S18 acetylase RimI-like enzyme